MTLALSLAQKKISVTIIEKNKKSKLLNINDSRTSAISQGSSRILTKLNIWNKLKDKSQKINSILVKDGEKNKIIHFFLIIFPGKKRLRLNGSNISEVRTVSLWKFEGKHQKGILSLPPAHGQQGLGGKLIKISFLKFQSVVNSNSDFSSDSRLRLKVSQKRGRVTDIFIQQIIPLCINNHICFLKIFDMVMCI